MKRGLMKRGVKKISQFSDCPQNHYFRNYHLHKPATTSIGSCAPCALYLSAISTSIPAVGLPSFEVRDEIDGGLTKDRLSRDVVLRIATLSR